MIITSQDSGNCSSTILSALEPTAFDNVIYKENFRIANLEYNNATGELLLEQYPDVYKSIVIGLNGNSTLYSHLNTVENIINVLGVSPETLDKLDKQKNYIFLNSSNPPESKYLYHHYNRDAKMWENVNFKEGDEVYCLSDGLKYRYLNKKLINAIDITLESSLNILNNKDLGINIKVSPSTIKEPVRLKLVSLSASGLMSKEDKLAFDTIDDKIGAKLELGAPIAGKVPLYLRTSNNILLSQVDIDLDDYIEDIKAVRATEDEPLWGIIKGDRILVITLTNKIVIKVSLEGWFEKFTGSSSNSIETTVRNSVFGANLKLDASYNLTSVSEAGVLTKLLWSGDSTKHVRFKRGLKSAYSAVTYADYIYFTSDTKEVIINDLCYGIDLLAKDLELVKKLTLTNIPGQLKVTNSNNSEYLLTFPRVTVSADGLMSYLDKVKLDAIQANAEVNVVNGLQFNNASMRIVDRKILLTDIYSKAEILEILKESVNYKGEVNEKINLPVNPKKGDIFKIITEKLGIATKALVVFTGAEWITFTGDLHIASSVCEGLMSIKHYDVLEALQIGNNYLDNTGTPNLSWQLAKPSGAKIKNTNGKVVLRNAADNAFVGLEMLDIVIHGNVTQEGSSFISKALIIEVADNTILLNKAEPGAGVTKGYAGIEIDRGTLPQYNIYFDETDDRFKAGQKGTELPIMLREPEGLLVNGSLLIWDSNTKLAKTSKNLDTELSRYLPLIGGTLTGNLAMTEHNITGVKGVSGMLGSLSTNLIELVSATTSTYINIGSSNFTIKFTSAGGLLRNNETIWDSGTDGHTSGLDADLLDGFHAAAFAKVEDIPVIPNIVINLGAGNYISSIAATNHTITATRGVLATELPNPYVLTITKGGAVYKVYKGDSALTIDIPVAKDLTITGLGANITYNGSSAATVNIPSIAITNSGSGDYISNITSNGHTITATKVAAKTLALLGGVPLSEDSIINGNITLNCAPSHGTYIDFHRDNVLKGSIGLLSSAHSNIIITSANNLDLHPESGGKATYLNREIATLEDIPISLPANGGRATEVGSSSLWMQPYSTNELNFSTVESLYIGYRNIQASGNPVPSLYIFGSSGNGTATLKAANFLLAGKQVATTDLIPTALKNPYRLSFSGLATGTYDGAAAVNIDIPQALLLTGGTMSGQIVGAFGAIPGIHAYELCPFETKSYDYASGKRPGISFHAVLQFGMFLYADDASTLKYVSAGGGTKTIATTELVPSIVNCVTTDGVQTITGAKTFTAPVSGTAGFYNTSDRKIKTNIKSIDISSSDIKLYEFEKLGTHSYGVIAQDMQLNYPSTVITGDDGLLQVNYLEVLTIKCAELENKYNILLEKNLELTNRMIRLEELLINKGLL